MVSEGSGNDVMNKCWHWELLIISHEQMESQRNGYAIDRDLQLGLFSRQISPLMVDISWCINIYIYIDIYIYIIDSFIYSFIYSFVYTTFRPLHTWGWFRHLARRQQQRIVFAGLNRRVKMWLVNIDDTPIIGIDIIVICNDNVIIEYYVMIIDI